MEYKNLREFTDIGMVKFEAFFKGDITELQIDANGSTDTRPVKGTKKFEAAKFLTSEEMAIAVYESMGQNITNELLQNKPLWAWLTFILKDTLFKKNQDGTLKSGELDTWMPSDPNNFQKAQRHKVRMPVLLYSQFGDDAIHALCGRPDTPGEVREHCTSQQDMFVPEMQKLFKRLYYDSETKKNVTGSGGKGGGSPRRLAIMIRQFEVTWDVQSFTVSNWLDKLPTEFDSYIKNTK